MVVVGLVVYILVVPLSLGCADRYFKSELAFIWSSFFFLSLFHLDLTHVHRSLLFDVFPSIKFWEYWNQQLKISFCKGNDGNSICWDIIILMLWIAASFHRPFFHVLIQIHIWIMIGGTDVVSGTQCLFS